MSSYSYGIIDAIKAGNEKVIKDIYQENYPKVERYIVTNSGTRDDARDIYQEAFLAAWRNIRMDRFIPQNETAVAGYIFQIAKNKWIDHLRTRKGKQWSAIAEAEIPDITVDHLSEEEENYIVAVKKHYNALGQQCRELLDRFYFRKDSLREIAAFFSWTEASAKNNKYRCLQQLRKMVTQQK